VPGGVKSLEALAAEPRAGVELLRAAGIGTGSPDRAAKGRKRIAGDAGVIDGADGEIGEIAAAFIKAVAQHRHWSRVGILFTTLVRRLRHARAP
jgi:hypothetical protein